MHGMKNMFRRHLVWNVSSQRIHGLRLGRHFIHLNFKICAKSMAESSKKTRTEEPPPPPPSHKLQFNFIPLGKPIKNFYELKTPTTPEEQEATYWVFTRSFPDGTRKPQGKVPPPLRARILAKGGSDVQLRAVNDKKTRK